MRLSEPKPPGKVSSAYSQGKFDPNHPVLSQSWLTMFEACAYAAFRRYVLGEIVRPSGAATRGTSLDAAVTHGANQVIATGKDATLTEKREVASATFDRKAPETDFQDDDPGSMKDRTIRLVDLHHREIAPMLNPVSTQESIRVEGDEFDLAGTIDIVEKDHVLVDTKGANMRGKHSVPGSAQASLYSFLYEKKYRVHPKAFRFDVLIDTKTPQVEQPSGEVTAHDYALLTHRLTAAFHEWQLGMKTGVWRLAEQGHWRCQTSGKWCAFLHTGCPKGKKL